MENNSQLINSSASVEKSDHQRAQKPKSANILATSTWIPGPHTLLPVNTKITWELLINNILKSISELNYSAKNDKKSLYITQTNQVVGSIRDMLASSQTTSREQSALLNENRILRGHHQHIMSSLSKLVLGSKVASGVWPPPDAVNKMRFQAGQVLLSIRHFVSVAQELIPDLKPIEGSPTTLGDFDIKGAELSDLEFISRIDAYTDDIVTSISQLVNMINGLIEHNPQQMGNQNYSDSPQVTSHMLSNNNISSLQSFSFIPNSMNSSASSYNTSELGLSSSIPLIIPSHPGTSSHVMRSQEGLIDQSRKVVTEIGQFLSLIEEIKINNILLDSAVEQQHPLLVSFKQKKEILYTTVNDLVTHARSTVEVFQPPNALQTLLDTSYNSLKGVEELGIAAKLVFDQEELIEQRFLAMEVESIGSKKREPSGE